jgi:NAD+ diphosphatase
VQLYDIGFTGSTLDRADTIRRDPGLLADAVQDPTARLLLLDKYRPEVTGELRLAWTELSVATSPTSLVLLGLAEGQPRFASIPSGPAPPRSAALLAAMDGLQPGEAAIYAAARAVLDWHARNGHCGECGNATTPFRAGWGRLCPQCGTEHFPRVDPVVIMLVEKGQEILLCRQPAFEPGRYTALSGFVEPGESIEEAVAREVMEEVGISVGEVRYVGSQPWPFASSLMIACIARAAANAICLDADELEDAIWASRSTVRSVLAGRDGPFLAPSRGTIALSLLKAWAAR